MTHGKELIDTGMKKERQRAEKAFELAESGKVVAVISSGDSGVYGMAPLLWEMKAERNSEVELEVVPGISAMFAAAARLGAPLGHDFCSISMSDLLTPWEKIEKRIVAAAEADFVTAVYNPLSKGRFWQLMRLKELFLEQRSPDTPVGIARNVGREDEKIQLVKLVDLDVSMADMFTVLIIGNSQTFSSAGKMVTPRGYYVSKEVNSDKLGRRIMNESFRTILENIDVSDRSLAHTWVALHCIHTTADFSLNESVELTNNVVEVLHEKLYAGHPPVIVTDVSMVTRGIRRATAQKLGLQIKCYLDDDRVRQMASDMDITRTQAGIRLAVQEHPNAIFAFGNAPTALIELVKLIRNGKAQPSGVVAAPVGFVNVRESKWQLKYGCPDLPAVFVNGRKGGSNVAATILNAILSWNEAKEMHPGEGL
ncbi:cobalt-precorrin-3B C(17)-methyltransferase [Saccharicrinis fermentans DSM 9555 = JCM 21142]|uniref:Cobalt-precorrin-3B C(17)-methyltransferase n=1 Tax=Saccharicrinis fermentans DSM 9555 = JCM 21142 TaxID=869213 RepID=W7XVH0_9BACT|nr:cobalt-precorrin-3B C(17)-methyltransferase [Saccharicrinis fermentans DSM 9555 = JCM 21142]